MLLTDRLAASTASASDMTGFDNLAAAGTQQTPSQRPTAASAAGQVPLSPPATATSAATPQRQWGAGRLLFSSRIETPDSASQERAATPTPVAEQDIEAQGGEEEVDDEEEKEDEEEEEEAIMSETASPKSPRQRSDNGDGIRNGQGSSLCLSTSQG
jgi:hypothetical protein